ncbi:bifunctional uridylyltransferase/uridylyl-removing protein GlnD [Shewanella schlegeliana]|uniref:Bifunctional uridylyltransferase/uridylyl-removing enzyme n=1 Tax=Shewanella schlegeliana TaxID=190308 RepID=A0ABS1SY22_9GAMM|nr:bifunctional uridylyltransferase/uridylyl-removing protein GlnD [Shewanella schlegeliana]MBL4913436.1 bifunctional uridylyltransferase/uridylyl-removing protein GlnD [Shewanella schlegeliana]MCL1108326.1 bifunctional uridylyltransferase/uridylyl-removing protein GlnD [Shewanella schlegeliana]GIU34423.1 bifunctional uridylyltransferase/uridylyl-removing enzyme [Shewanella schlegeliana]
MNSAQSAKNALIDLNQTILDSFNAKSDIRSIVSTRCQHVDKLLQQQWSAHQLDQFPIALVAVGGYGRGELHPQSDVDLLFLTEGELSQDAEQALSAFIAFIWDAGLEVGHSVRSIEQTLEQGRADITVATNLLESRLLCGPQALFTLLYRNIRQDDFWPSSEFYVAKRDEQAARHSRANAFDLEPNLKSCPGGLRDIQTVAWVAMRHFNAERFEELVYHGFLDPVELDELLEAQDFLWRLRCSLHLVSGRDENRLLFDLQPQVAKLMGYEDGTQLAVEQMMKNYYRTVRRVMELNQMLLQLFKRATLGHIKALEVVPIDENFQRRGKFIESLSSELFDDPENILNLFLWVAKNSNIQAIYAVTLRSLRRARRAQPQALMYHESCRKLFMQVLRHPRGIVALSLMHKHGVLSAYLPAWRAIEGQMQFDLFHAYTVDEHTHRLLLNIESFAQPEQKEEFPLGSVLINQLPKKGLLVLAAIFHDIAKGRGGDHSKLGAIDALEFCKLHGMNDHDGRLVSWLVENHLVMSVTAQRRDISDPDVVADFAEHVRDAVHLSYLYCLTVADICATNERTWNNWKGSLLRDLYFSTQRVLARGKEKPVDIRARVREHQAKAKKELLRRGIKEKDLDALWQRFKADYFLRNQPNQIAWHAEAIIKHKQDETLVVISKHMTRGGTELFVYGKDKPKLFATVMAILDNKNITVHDASIMTSKDNYALDSFVILEQDGEPVSQLSRIQGIKKTLIKALSNETPKLPKFRNLSRKMKPFKVATQVSFPATRSHGKSMMELIALDSPGLLARVGEILYRCEITLLAAKITTIGERAEDFFLLQTADGQQLDDTQQAKLREALTSAL